MTYSDPLLVPVKHFGDDITVDFISMKCSDWLQTNHII